MHFRGSSARSSCSLSVRLDGRPGTVRVPSGPSVAAASKARFALSSKRTPTSLFSLTSVSGFLSVDAPEPMSVAGRSRSAMIALGLLSASCPKCQSAAGSPF